MATERESDIFEAVAGIISLLADGLEQENKEIVREVGGIIDSLIDDDPKTARKVFKGVTFVAARMLIEDTED